MGKGEFWPLARPRNTQLTLPFYAGQEDKHGIATLDPTNHMSDREVLALHTVDVSQIDVSQVGPLSEEVIAEMANIFRAFTMVAMVGCSKEGNVNCMALAGVTRDILPYLGTILCFVSRTGTPCGFPGESQPPLFIPGPQIGFHRRLGPTVLEPRRQIVSALSSSYATTFPHHHHTRGRVQGFFVGFELWNSSRKGGGARWVSSGRVGSPGPGLSGCVRYAKGAALFLPPFSWFLMVLFPDDPGGVCKELPSSWRG